MSLVSARHVKNVSGRKSDVMDCQWLQQLMSYGLLSGAFRPADDICAIRAMVRTRDMLLQYQGQHIQHMQKALTQMNLQLGNVISDIAGASGMAILRAILAGERTPQVLAELCDRRIRASREDVVKSLMGNWREEHLFALRVAVELYDAYHVQMQACDVQLSSMLTALERNQDTPEPGRRRSASRNAPKFDVRTALFRLSGVDLTTLNGIDVNTALKVLVEIGPDMTRFKSGQAFRLLVGTVSRHEHFGWQSTRWQKQTHCQSCRTRLATGGYRPPFESIGFGGVLPQSLCPSGSGQGHHSYGP